MSYKIKQLDKAVHVRGKRRFRGMRTSEMGTDGWKNREYESFSHPSKGIWIERKIFFYCECDCSVIAGWVKMDEWRDKWMGGWVWPILICLFKDHLYRWANLHSPQALVSATMPYGAQKHLPTMQRTFILTIWHKYSYCTYNATCLYFIGKKLVQNVKNSIQKEYK